LSAPREVAGFAWVVLVLGDFRFPAMRHSSLKIEVRDAAKSGSRPQGLPGLFITLVASRSGVRPGGKFASVSRMNRLGCLLPLAAFVSVWAAEAPDLPVLTKGATVLFIGDSITDGGRARTGSDYNHTMGQDYAFILAATLGYQFAERDLTFINRGISGNRVSDLCDRWQADVLDAKPDVLSVLVGLNDTLRENPASAEEFERIYDELIQRTLAALPKVRIILGQPFLLPVGKHQENYAQTLAELKKRQDAVARLAAKYSLPLVRYQEAFDDACHRAPADHWSWDGVHPHYAGHALMADLWTRTLATLRPAN
jgi:lysophospholipase L1-like esterase